MLSIALLYEQPLPHYIHTLPHCEVETDVDRALRPLTPESPPARRSAESAMAPVIYFMLSEQHDHACKQTDRLLFELCWPYWLFASELVG